MTVWFWEAWISHGKRRVQMSAKKMFLIVAALMIAVFGSSVFASGGKIPVYAAGTISASGSYYLTQNITGNIAIGASNIVLDLNGLTLTGNISIGGSNVRVTNGTVTEALICTGFSEITLDGLTIHCGAGDGIQLSNCRSCRITYNKVTQSFGNGIYLSYSHSNTISNNTVFENTKSGIRLENSDGNMICDNLVAGNAQAGGLHSGIYFIESSGNELSRNIISRNWYGRGVHLDSLSAGNSVSNNVISLNGIYAGGYSGMEVSGNSNIIDKNTASGNGTGISGWGISVGGSNNVITYNRTPGNAQGGLNFGVGNIVAYYDAAQTAPTNF
jgi:parallel beta-helix repeat protein